MTIDQDPQLTRPLTQPSWADRPARVQVDVPETSGYRLKSRLLGHPLYTEDLAHERLGKPTALAVFASDNLSSSAYATEEILRVLIPVIGVAAFSMVVPITVALLVVLGFLILSYRQTIKAYPSAGGAYVVTKDNFGKVPSLIAGVSLLTDYVLTVAVSVAAGSAALASAVPALAAWVVPISVFFIVVIAFGNLRGVKESGKVFAVPTYFFLFNMLVLLVWGLAKMTAGSPADVVVDPTRAGEGRKPRGRVVHGRDPLRRAAGLRLRRRGRHRRRGDLQRRAGLSGAVVAQRPHDPGDDGNGPRGHVPRSFGRWPAPCTSPPSRTARRR